ncbi:maleylpyruvate isomerase family mycothiol-dependent enzyme [Aeromicrobium phragmitis]|uniref:Maleylpyruvate isomerase family mycothiol-dependent enzyme n=1 Tax=Aeromicrobium phragmitis TaxID=2478914 RepID=A0A3L8PRN7_9ACTN|nr:maleylpyruvate isomerase family mycothiol-dependent enzyme [Aeromicrobium phragmitis]RLV57559.1 maleylpyruvate isomerase family mycothiol-dependent enzyme [Aeromicrobium phragmitis]
MSLQTYVDAWRHSVNAVLDLDLTADDADRVTDLPGWSVRDVVAHLVHLEEVLADGSESARPDGPKGLSAEYTQAGVDALNDVPLPDLLARLRAAVDRRSAQLEVLPDDPQAVAPSTLAGTPWTWDTLLRNRAIDAWMHEQDLRRALGRSGNLDSPGAHVAVQSFRAALPFVVGKRAGAPADHPVGVVVTGAIPFTRTVAVGEDGRAGDTDADPKTTLTMDTESFAILGGGRRKPGQVPVTVEGDTELAHRVLTGLAVTP